MQMQNKISFGKWEAITLLINLMCTKIYLYFTRIMVEDAGTAGWILSIYISLIVLILYAIMIRLFRGFDGMDIMDIAGGVGGRALKIITGLVISFALFLFSSAVLREFTEEMKEVSLPRSPLSYIMLFFIMGVVVGGYLGIEAIVRYHAIMIPVIAAGLVIIFIFVIPQMDRTNLYPVLGNGAYALFGKGAFRISVFGELLVLFLLPPFLGGYENVKKAGYLSIVLSAFFFIISSLAYILTFPYPSNLESFLPIYQMARRINLGRFFQRIESVFVFVWAMSALIYLASTFYFMIYTFAKATGLKYIRPLILPFAVLVFSAAFIPSNLVSLIDLRTNFIEKTSWIVSFAFIGLILILANLRKRRRGEVPSK